MKGEKEKTSRWRGLWQAFSITGLHVLLFCYVFLYLHHPSHVFLRKTRNFDEEKRVNKRIATP